MTGTKDITQLCFSSNLAGIVANKLEQNFYSVYFYSGIEKTRVDWQSRREARMLPP